MKFIAKKNQTGYSEEELNNLPATTEKERGKNRVAAVPYEITGK